MRIATAVCISRAASQPQGTHWANPPHVSTVGCPSLRVLCQVPELASATFTFTELDKTFKNGKTTAGLVSCSSQPVEKEEEATEMEETSRHPGFVLVEPQSEWYGSSLFSEMLHFVEQHRLTNATKSGQQKTLFRALLSHAGEQDAQFAQGWNRDPQALVVGARHRVKMDY